MKQPFTILQELSFIRYLLHYPWSEFSVDLKTFKLNHEKEDHAEIKELYLKFGFLDTRFYLLGALIFLVVYPTLEQHQFPEAWWAWLVALLIWPVVGFLAWRTPYGTHMLPVYVCCAVMLTAIVLHLWGTSHLLLTLPLSVMAILCVIRVDSGSGRTMNLPRDLGCPFGKFLDLQRSFAKLKAAQDHPVKPERYSRFQACTQSSSATLGDAEPIRRPYGYTLDAWHRYQF